MNYHYVPNSLEYNQSFLDKRDLTCDCEYCKPYKRKKYERSKLLKDEDFGKCI